MIAGFTGSSKGLTYLQVHKLIYLLSEYAIAVLHHGDCIGADELAHGIAKNHGIRVVIHPPDNPKKRAFCKSDDIRVELPYLVRNKNIVAETNILFATPNTQHETLRSGTWATIRYARKFGKPQIIIYQNGTTSDDEA